jgi:hypothetical protein
MEPTISMTANKTMVTVTISFQLKRCIRENCGAKVIAKSTKKTEIKIISSGINANLLKLNPTKLPHQKQATKNANHGKRRSINNWF